VVGLPNTRRIIIQRPQIVHSKVVNEKKVAKRKTPWWIRKSFLTRQDIFLAKFILFLAWYAIGVNKIVERCRICQHEK
jgi:hypothetical protein